MATLKCTDMVHVSMDFRTCVVQRFSVILHNHSVKVKSGPQRETGSYYPIATSRVDGLINELLDLVYSGRRQLQPALDDLSALMSHARI